VDLISNFPWKTQREKIEISLTNPSITIEGKNNDFLKIALYYNQKYVLHYFDDRQTLFTRSFNHLEDGFSFIKKYFEQSRFDLAGFKKEITWFQNNLIHFSTQDFRYYLTPKSTWNYLLSTSGINFILSIVLLIMVLMKPLDLMDVWALILVLSVMFLMGGGLHLIFFFRYYRRVRDKILIMSRGNDIFYFGSLDKPVKYDKKDLLEYTITRIRQSKNPFSGFAVAGLKFKDGTVIQIPNLLVDDLAMENKLFEYKRIDKNSFPFL
jgi:hypothetical protein